MGFEPTPFSLARFQDETLNHLGTGAYVLNCFTYCDNGHPSVMFFSSMFPLRKKAMGLSDTCPSAQGHVRHGPSPLVTQGPSPLVPQGPYAGHRSPVTGLPVTHPGAYSSAACPETFVPYSSTVTFDAHELLSAFPSMRVQDRKSVV